MKSPKAIFKVIRNVKTDYKRKNREGSIIWYPKYKAKLSFLGKETELSSYDSVSYFNIDFKKRNSLKISDKALWYGEDFTSQNGDLIVIHYVKRRGQKLVTAIDIMG